MRRQTADAMTRWRLPFRYRGSRRRSAVAQLFSLGGFAIVMKRCNYCGRESEDDAPQCSGCGLSEFTPSLSAMSQKPKTKTSKSWMWVPGVLMFFGGIRLSVIGWSAYKTGKMVYFADKRIQAPMCGSAVFSGGIMMIALGLLIMWVFRKKD